LLTIGGKSLGNSHNLLESGYGYHGVVAGYLRLYSMVGKRTHDLIISSRAQ